MGPKLAGRVSPKQPDYNTVSVSHPIWASRVVSTRSGRNKGVLIRRVLFRADSDGPAVCPAGPTAAEGRGEWGLLVFSSPDRTPQDRQGFRSGDRAVRNWGDPSSQSPQRGTSVAQALVEGCVAGDRRGEGYVSSSSPDPPPIPHRDSAPTRSSCTRCVGGRPGAAPAR